MTQPGTWVDGLLEPGGPAGALRVRVHTWLALMPLDTQPERPSSPGQLLAYVKKVGPWALSRKIRSRFFHGPPPMWFGCGLGQVVTPGPSFGLWTPFLATRHPLAQTHLCCWHTLACDPPIQPPCWGTLTPQEHLADTSTLMPYAGACPIDPWAGSEQEAERVLTAVLGILTQTRAGAHPVMHPEGQTLLRDRHTQGPPRTERGPTGPPALPSYRLFGWGHYARTCIEPHLGQHMTCVGVHEIDPWLSAACPERPWSTSPEPPPVCGARAWVLAGFHHGHGPLATEAIRRGIAVVVEKPAVTTRAQLEAMLEVWRSRPKAQVFTGFHRRHMALDRWLREDLGAATKAHGVSMHTVVHEIALPPHHWYRWAVSGSRLLSNGCHWIDQFLWLNPDASVLAQGARGQRTGDTCQVWIELDNGAHFSMALSEEGSDRVGMREMTQWSRRGKMARLVDQTYVSESKRGILRKGTIKEAKMYEAMYGRFARQIVAGEPGDTLEDFARVWGVILGLEEDLKERAW